jgi:sulfatase modifying factor 1
MTIRGQSILGLLIMSLVLGGPAAAVVDIDLVPVGDPGNPDDLAVSRGAVAYAFSIGRYEVTNVQYTAFLNAVDPGAANTLGLYDYNVNNTAIGGIACCYTVKPEFADKPVNGVSWFDAARFVNWLENGQPTGGGGTETGAYDLTGVDPADSDTWSSATRSPDAHWRLPTYDEWHKAAYYDPVDPGADALGTPDYWLYPTRSDEAPTPALCDATGAVTNPGSNVATYDQACEWNASGIGNVSTVGGSGSASFYGTFDQGGNVSEWIEPDAFAGGFLLGERGGSYLGSASVLASDFASGIQLDYEGDSLGFRVVRVPEVGGVLAGFATLGALAAWRRRPRTLLLLGGEAGASQLPSGLRGRRDWLPSREAVRRPCSTVPHRVPSTLPASD